MSHPPAVSSNIVIIDSRSASYDGDAIRLMAIMTASTGKLIIKKQDSWHDQPVAKENVMVVTDTPTVFKHWGLSFNEDTQMREVMAAYKAVKAAGSLQLDSAILRYDPEKVIQTRKMDESGRALDFDSMGLNNGHIAVLLAVWASRKIYGGYHVTSQPEDIANGEDEDDGFDMLPFSV